VIRYWDDQVSLGKVSNLIRYQGKQTSPGEGKESNQIRHHLG
jgi:hypothetical protein